MFVPPCKDAKKSAIAKNEAILKQHIHNVNRDCFVVPPRKDEKKSVIAKNEAILKAIKKSLKYTL